MFLLILLTFHGEAAYVVDVFGDAVSDIDIDIFNSVHVNGAVAGAFIAVEAVGVANAVNAVDVADAVDFVEVVAELQQISRIRECSC